MNFSKTHIRWTVEQLDENRRLKRSYSFLTLASSHPEHARARINKWIARTDGMGEYIIKGRNLRTGRRVHLDVG